MSVKYIIVSCAFLFCGMGNASGQSATTLQDGNWDDTTVWSGHRVPDVHFDAITILHTIHIRAPYSSNVVLSGSLMLTAGDLVLEGISLTLNGPVIQNGGALATTDAPDLIIGGSGSLPTDLPIHGDSKFNSFQLSRPGSTFASGSDMQVNTLALFAGIFANNGMVTVAPNGLIDIRSTSTTAGVLLHALSSAGSYDLHYTNTSALSTGPELPSEAAIHHFTKSGSGVLTLRNDLSISGDLIIATGMVSDGDSSLNVTLAGNFTSNGSTDLTSSTFTFASPSGSSISGTVNPSFGELIFLHNTSLSTGCRVQGNLRVAPEVIVTATTGTFSFGGITNLVNEGTLALSSLTVLSNATLTVDQFPFSVAGNFTVSAGGSFTAGAGANLYLAGNLSVTGTFSSVAGMTFSDTTKMTGTGIKNFKDIFISGKLTPNSAYTISGDLNLYNSGTLIAGNSTTTFNGNCTIANSGTGTITFNNITIGPDQTLTSISDFTITGATLTWNNGVFRALGAVHFGRTGTTTLRGTGTYVFRDIVIASGTTFTPNAPYTITGDLTVNGTLRSGNSTTFFGGTTSIISDGTPAISFNHFFINAGNFLSAFAGTMTVNGNFTNNGLFNANGGTITFAGSTTKNISGSHVTTFNNITVSNGSAATDVSIEDNQAIAGILTLATNSHLDADGSANTSIFTLLSLGDHPTIDASVATLPNGAMVQGNVTVQRYLSLEGSHDNSIYRYISPSVSNATVSDLQQEIPVTGLFAGSSSCPRCGSAPSMFWYDETVVNGGVNAGYTAFPVSINSEALIPGRGYAVFTWGNSNPILSAGYDLRGPINSGLINYNVTYTSSGIMTDDGWNLIGNPYPSTIDWNAGSGWVKTHVSGSTYVLDNGTNPSRFATWNGMIGTNGGSRNIAAGQGFYVQTNSTAPLLTSNESVKIAGKQTTFFREEGPSNVLRIALMSGTMSDEAVIHFRDSATDDFDFKYDALKLKNHLNGTSTNSFLNVATLSPQGHQKLAINSLDPYPCATRVSLDVADIPAGQYELDFSNMESFSNDASMLLSDNFISPKLTFDIRQQTKYIFEVTADPQSISSERFELLFSHSIAPARLLMRAPDVCRGSVARVFADSTQSGMLYSLQLNGNSAGQSLIGTGGEISFTLPQDTLHTGTNYFEMIAQSQDCAGATYSQVDSIKILAIPQIIHVWSMGHCKEGSVMISTATEIPSGNYYNWYETLLDTLPIAGQSAATFITPSLTQSRTYYVAAVNVLGCESERVPAIAKIINYDEALITELNSNTLQSNFVFGNHWYLDGQILGDTSRTLKIQSAGTYTLEVHIENCLTSTEKSLITTGLTNTLAGLQVYPNPVSGILSVDINDHKSPVENYLSVFDETGFRIGTLQLVNQGALKKGQFDFTGFPAGLYYLGVISDNIMFAVKVIRK